jgi:hypothetical protein
MMEGTIPLSEMIQVLREEIEAAQAQSANSNLKFKLETAEIELTVAVTKTKSASGGIQVWVIEAGGEYSKANVTTHKFKLVLKSTQSGSIEVTSDQRRRISND